MNLPTWIYIPICISVFLMLTSFIKKRARFAEFRIRSIIITTLENDILVSGTGLHQIIQSKGFSLSQTAFYSLMQTYIAQSLIVSDGNNGPRAMYSLAQRKNTAPLDGPHPKT